MPNDPVSALAEQAAALHEFYESLQESGFTQAEALRLIGEMLAASGRSQP